MPDSEHQQGRSRDSVANTLIVAIGLSLVASVLVASTAIILKPVQERNEERYRQQIILDVAGLYSPGADIGSLFANIDTRMLDLDSGEFTDAISADGFDETAAAKDQELGIGIPAAADIANIRRRARFAPR